MLNLKKVWKPSHFRALPLEEYVKLSTFEIWNQNLIHSLFVFKKRFNYGNTTIKDLLKIFLYPFKLVLMILFGYFICFYEKKYYLSLISKKNHRNGMITTDVYLYTTNWKEKFSDKVKPQSYTQY